MLLENFFRYCLFIPSRSPLKDLFALVGVVHDVQAGFQSRGTAAAAAVGGCLAATLYVFGAGVLVVINEQEETCRAKKDGN